MLKKIYKELVLIRKELQAIRICVESNSEYVTVIKAHHLKSQYNHSLNKKVVTEKQPTFQEVLQASRQYLREL